MKKPTHENESEGITLASLITHTLKEDAKRTISDEQMERVAGPIKEMVLAGYFTDTYVQEKPKKQKHRWLPVFTALAATLIIALSAFPRVFSTHTQSENAHMEIHDSAIPLAGSLTEEDILHFPVTLINEESMETLYMPQGIREPVPDGAWSIYRVISGNDVEVGILVVENGAMEIVPRE